MGTHRKDVKSINAFFKWFNENIPCPPFKANKNKWTEDAASWWKETKLTKEAVSRCRQLAKIVNKEHVGAYHGMRIIYTRNPGKIIYEDKYQVVAETKTKEIGFDLEVSIL